MKKITSKVLLVAISIFAVMCLASQVFASDLLIVDDGANNTSSTNTSLNSLTSLNSANTANTSKVTANSILNSTNNTNKSTYANTNSTNTTLPKTGSDYTLSIVLVAAIASAIFAFIRIRNYKNI